MNEESKRTEGDEPRNGKPNISDGDLNGGLEILAESPNDDLDILAGISKTEKARRDKILTDYNRAKAEADRNSAIDGNVHVTVVAVGTIIGRGHHSNVYRAELSGSRSPVALKVDYRNLMKEYPRVWEKVKALREIENDRIQRLIEFVPDWERNRSYMILDYVPGETLQKTLYDRTHNGGAPFPQGRVLNWTLQILDALQYLHRHRLLHGDINLSNIMLRPKKGKKGAEEEEHDICLIDFNWSAPDLEEGETRPDIRSDDPTDNRFEKATNKEEFQRGIRRDIYHVGAVMYQLLTGEVPDLDKGRLELVKEEKATDESEKRRKLKEHGVTDDVAEVILTAISVDPQRRYRSAKKMQDALTKLPLANNETEKTNNRLKTTVIPCVCAVLGILLIAIGLFQNSHFRSMREYAAKAADEFAQGNYTEALRLARQAVGNRTPSMFVPAEGEEILARVLSLNESGAGYRPWASLSIGDGFPVRVRLSPDENWLVVLRKRNAQDAETSAILAYSMTESKTRSLQAVSGLDDFGFADNHTILYADGNRLVCYDLNSGTREWEQFPPPGESDTAPVALAVSGNETRAAVIYPESSQVYLYNTSNGSLWKTVTLDETPQSLRKRMFLLDEEGDALAVSLSGADVGAYDISGSEAVRFEGVALTETDNDYTDYEGGFYGSWLLLTASITYEDGETRGEGHRFRLDEMRSGADEYLYHLERSDTKPYRVRTDRNGMFLAVGNSYLRVTENMGRWGPTTDKDGEILLLEHLPDDNGGRLLTGIRREIFVTDDNGAELAHLTDTELWNLGALSPEWLVLAGTDRQRLSVLRWTPERVWDGAAFDLNAMRKEADEWWNALSVWNGRIEEE